jgi:hypothetical protein
MSRLLSLGIFATVLMANSMLVPDSAQSTPIGTDGIRATADGLNVVDTVQCKADMVMSTNRAKVCIYLHSPLVLDLPFDIAEAEVDKEYPPAQPQDLLTEPLTCGIARH